MLAGVAISGAVTTMPPPTRPSWPSCLPPHSRQSRCLLSPTSGCAPFPPPQKALSYTNYETSSVKLVDGTQGMDERYEFRIHCEVALTLYL